MHLTFFCNHKCGSSWFYKYLGEFASLNEMPFVTTNRGWKGYTKAELPEKAVIFYRNSQYDTVALDCEAGVRIIRHPGSVVTSAYYSHLNSHEVSDWQQLKYQREILQKVDKDMGMALTVSFLEKSNFYFSSAGPLNCFANWLFDDPRFITMRMEDFVLNPGEYLRKSIVANGFDPAHLLIPDEEKYTFEAMSGRKIGEADQNSHYRSGKPDDWKRQLPQAVKIYLSTHFSTLIDRYYTNIDK
jgi:hypothetical protein